ncbi:hypothetical protein [Alkalicoccus luteus]|uniref:hypothetical protein n=1 Tax=Alkalicoccus luteus TaxID=1237094 RepID=UPI0040339744
MKLIIALAALLLFLSGCSQDEEQTLEGRYMFTLSMEGSFQLFVEDSYTGSSYRYLNGLQTSLPVMYEAESYLIHTTEETVFTDLDTGESALMSEIDFPLHWPNQHLEILVSEEIEPFTRTLERPVTEESRLFPIYTAEEIKAHPYTSEDFIEVHTPVEDDHYMLFLFDENFNREYLLILDEFGSQAGERYGVYIDVNYYAPDYFETFMEIDDTPSYLVLSSAGEAIRTSDWEEIRSWFSTEAGIGMPREGDPAWRELLY